MRILCLIFAGLFLSIPAIASIEIPAGTQVYLVTNTSIVAKGDAVNVGMIINSRVARDVRIQGQTVIKAGTPAIVNVSSMKKRNVAGVKGKLALTAVETQTVDKQTVYLTGGYNKEGKSRMGWALGVGILIAWPVLFLPGTAAELPAGTMISTYTSGAVEIVGRKPRRTVNLSGLLSGFEVVVLYNELDKTDTPKYFDFLITAPIDAPKDFYIDSINGGEAKKVKIDFLSIEESDEDEKSFRARVKIKPLAKQFKKGINRFDVVYIDTEGMRQATEVILDIDF
jgi:hypothetical protein